MSNEINQGDSRENAPVRRQPSSCLLEPYPGSSKTVSVRALRIPEKAENEFQKACLAVQAHKLEEAERHVRKGLQIYPADAMGWVMLGKLLEMEDHIEEAGEACSQGAMHDPSSWTAALCLAEIYGCEHKWANSVAESNLAMSLNPESKRLADYFSAVALYNLGRLAEAESRALEAERLDRGHELPHMELLIAKIEEFKGDSPNAIAQLREYLKYAKDSPQTESAKKELARLESETK
jgi:tetratricopeptide (TPR) repeat protein